MCSSDLERLAYQELSVIRKARGDPSGALETYRAFKAVEDALFSEARTRRIEAMTAEYELDRNSRDIQRLTDEAALAPSRAEPIGRRSCRESE